MIFYAITATFVAMKFWLVNTWYMEVVNLTLKQVHPVLILFAFTIR